MSPSQEWLPPSPRGGDGGGGNEGPGAWNLAEDEAVGGLQTSCPGDQLLLGLSWVGGGITLLQGE